MCRDWGTRISSATVYMRKQYAWRTANRMRWSRQFKRTISRDMCIVMLWLESMDLLIRPSVVYWTLLAAFPSTPSSVSSSSADHPYHRTQETWDAEKRKTDNRYLSNTIVLAFETPRIWASNVPLQVNEATLSRYHRFHSIRKIDGTLPFVSVHRREIPHITDYRPARHHHV